MKKAKTYTISRVPSSLIKTSNQVSSSSSGQQNLPAPKTDPRMLLELAKQKVSGASKRIKKPKLTDDQMLRKNRISKSMSIEDKKIRFQQEISIIQKKIEKSKEQGNKKQTQKLQNQISAKRNRLKNWTIQEEIPQCEKKIQSNKEIIE